MELKDIEMSLAWLLDARSENPFNGIESTPSISRRYPLITMTWIHSMELKDIYYSARGRAPRYTGIHSMELKVDHNSGASAPAEVFVNPFNGIERLGRNQRVFPAPLSPQESIQWNWKKEYLKSQAKHNIREESIQWNWKLIAPMITHFELAYCRNPFNGIERVWSTNPIASTPTNQRIHSMELKEDWHHELTWPSRGIHSMELKVLCHYHSRTIVFTVNPFNGIES